MLKNSTLLLACLATVVVPTLGNTTPAPTTMPSPSAPQQLTIPSNIRNNIQVNPTIMGKIDKPASVSCNQLTVRLTEYAPSNFPQSGGTAVLTNSTRTSCTYKIQVPQALLGKKAYLWGNLKNPSPLVTVEPVGWNNPLPLPPQLGVVENFNFVVKEAVMH